MIPKLNQILHGDCIDLLKPYDEPFADMVFADPPFNIGFKYDVYEDRKGYDAYYQWTQRWMAACNAVLKPEGSFWIAIGAEYAAEVRMIGRELGLSLRNWVIWHYTFGQHTKMKFARGHVHLFYFVKDPTAFTFNVEATSIFSDREKEYGDKRANPTGRLPDDVWGDFPRVCGSFTERVDWHPCQMPEALLSRIIRTCSNVGDVVLDPFCGSGTTPATAKKLNRRYLSSDVSQQYVTGARERLEQTAPFTNDTNWPREHITLLAQTYSEMSLSREQLCDKPMFAERFTQRFNNRLSHSGATGQYASDDVLAKLLSLTAADLPRIKTHVKEADFDRARRPKTKAKPKKSS